MSEIEDDYAEMWDEERNYFCMENDDGAPGLIWLRYHQEDRGLTGYFHYHEAERFIEKLQVVIDRVKRDAKNV